MKCLNCQQETDNPKFCSKSCAGTYNNIISPKRLPTKKCKGCGVLISARKRYCSDKCKNNYKFLHQKNKKLNSISVIEHRRSQKLKYIEYKGGKCEKCGYDKCPAALEFHHLDPKTKLFGLGSRIIKWETAKTELDKCILLCANCHRELESQK